MTKDLLQNIKAAEPFEVDPTPFWSQYIPQVIFTPSFIGHALMSTLTLL